MSTVLEIEQAISRLSPDEMRSVAGWLNARLPRESSQARKDARRQARGLWKDRNDLPDLRALRAEWDRS